MSKKSRAIVLSAIILGLFIGGYAFNIQRNNRIDTTLTSDEAAVEVLQTDICTLKNQTITRVEIKDEEVMTLVKTGEKWINEDEPELTYNNQIIEEFVAVLQNLQSKEIIGPTENLSEYGINETAKMITLYDSANGAQTFRIGNLLESENKLYVTTDDAEFVYSVSYDEVKVLFTKKEDFIDKTLVLPGEETLTQIEINKKDEKSMLLKKDEKREIWTLDNYYTYNHQADSEKIATLMDQIATLQKDSYAGKIEADSDYGFDEPTLILTLNEEAVLTFGAHENGMVYVRYNEEAYAYKMNEQRISGIEDLKPLQVLNKEVYNADLSTLKQITLTNPQKTYTLVFAEDLAEELAATLNDKALSLGEAEDLFHFIQNSICIEALLQNPQIEQQGDRKAEITVTYTLKDGEENCVELIPYDINFYILRFNGEIEFAVGKEKVTALFNRLAGK